MMVLGVVVQQSDTVTEIGRRLKEQFAIAGFANGAAHNNLPSLADEGYVRLVRPGPPGEPTQDFYEATQAGREHLSEWLRTTSASVLVRDILQCKLTLAGDRDDLDPLLQFVRSLEGIFTGMCDLAHARVLRDQRSRRASAKKPQDWRKRLRSIQTKDEANLWNLMSERLSHLGDDLEKLLADITAEETV
jgi:DNA-binding PadR family transcriptional regulator